MWLMGAASAGVLLSWLSLPMLPPLLRLIFNERGKVLNQALAKTAQLELVFAALFSVGIIL